LLLFFLFTALFARYCIFKIVFSYSAIQPHVCLINSVKSVSQSVNGPSATTKVTVMLNNKYSSEVIVLLK